MDNISNNIANNILKMRKINKWTQSDLANKLNYSDKAISKWERGESIPDITTLCMIAELFKVNIDYLTKDHSDSDIEKTQGHRQLLIRNILITVMLCVSVYLIATVVFVYLTMNSPSLATKNWVSFVVAFPFCCLIVSFYARHSNRWLISLIAVSSFVWGTITTIFLINTVVYELPNSWMLFFVGIPIEVAICLYFLWKLKK